MASSVIFDLRLDCPLCDGRMGNAHNSAELTLGSSAAEIGSSCVSHAYLLYLYAGIALTSMAVSNTKCM